MKRLLPSVKQDLKKLTQNVEKKEIQSLLGQEQDANNSYLSIHAGAGGTEAADWVQILVQDVSPLGGKTGFSNRAVIFK